MRYRGAPRYIVAIVAAVVGGSLLEPVLAQPLDIERELTEAQQSKVPFLQSHPWREFRQEWLDEMNRLDREIGLRAGVSYTTTYQHAAGVDSPNDTFAGNLDVFAR